jgi:hypothetical protein
MNDRGPGVGQISSAYSTTDSWRCTGVYSVIRGVSTILRNVAGVPVGSGFPMQKLRNAWASGGPNSGSLWGVIIVVGQLIRRTRTTYFWGSRPRRPQPINGSSNCRITSSWGYVQPGWSEIGPGPACYLGSGLTPGSKRRGLIRTTTGTTTSLRSTALCNG